VNHDKHYASKEIEPIQVIEETIERLTGKLDSKAVFNIGQSLKYLLRAGLKEGESVEKDLDKAFNYLHRAIKGGWVESAPIKEVGKITFESLMEKYGLNKAENGYYTSVCGLSVCPLITLSKSNPNGYMVYYGEREESKRYSLDGLGKALDEYFN